MQHNTTATGQGSRSRILPEADDLGRKQDGIPMLIAGGNKHNAVAIDAIAMLAAVPAQAVSRVFAAIHTLHNVTGTEYAALLALADVPLLPAEEGTTRYRATGEFVRTYVAPLASPEYRKYLRLQSRFR